MSRGRLIKGLSFSAFREFRRGRLIAACILTALQQPCRSQEDAIPQEPAWGDQAPMGASGNSDATAQPSTESETDSSQGSASPGDTSSDSPVGVPDEANFSLPNFRNYGQSFFERDGLKFRIGPVHLRLGLMMAEEYNDNIFGSPIPTPDLITRIGPEFRLGMGDFQSKEEDYLALDYKPQFLYYLDTKENNQVNQNLLISGQGTFSRYSTEVMLTYISSSSPNATQSGGENYSTLDFEWQNRYMFAPKTFTALNFGALLQEGSAENSYQTLSVSPQLGYEYSPKTTVFVAPAAGVAYIGEGGSQAFQALSIGFQYNNLRKLQFNGTAGIQARQFRGLNATGAQNFTTPVFDFNLIWQWRENTVFRASLVRNVQISDVVRGLTYTGTEGTIGFGTKLLGKVNFSLELSYQMLDYQGDPPLGRTEYFAVVSPSLGYSFTNGLEISLYYVRQQRTSEIESYEYLQNIYGVRVNYQF